MKRKLRLDDLAVESFGTTREPVDMRGTVRGLAGTLPPSPGQSYPECYSGQLTCITPNSCDFSCGGTCDLSCGGSCYISCGDTCPVSCSCVLPC
jgi:hypothetical protein